MDNRDIGTMWSSSYYRGAIEGYERDIERAKTSGVTIDFNRLGQFKIMLDDFVLLERKVIELSSKLSD